MFATNQYWLIITVTQTRIIYFPNTYTHGIKIFVVFVNPNVSRFFNITYIYDNYLLKSHFYFIYTARVQN